ncbi:MAG: YdcF family protein [Pseudomonadota bacterium]
MATLSFVITKLLWFLFRPDNLLVFGLVFAVIALRTRLHKWGQRVLIIITCVFVALSFLPIGDVLIGTLEDRYPSPVSLPENVEGIVILGGAIQADVSADRHVMAFYPEVGRLTGAIPLMRKFPHAKVVFAGGSGALFDQTLREADFAKRFFSDLGLDTSRIIFDRDSRNTFENAVETIELGQPTGTQPWILVTSAYHMPRSVGTFRKAGLEVIPYPVDYRTVRSRIFRFSPGLFTSADVIRTAVKEWGGLIAYYLMGRTSQFLP